MPRHVARWLDDEAAQCRARSTLGAALRRLGDAVAGGPAEAPARRAVQGAAQARHAASRAGRDRRARTASRCCACPSDEWRRARRLRADRSPAPTSPARSTRRITASGATTRARTAARTGLKEKDGAFKKSAFGVTLAGCPLEEKISEMNLVEGARQQPSARWPSSPSTTRCAPATGHRICNDCMKSCIYPEAGAGRHPAGRDPHAEGRAGAALGLRDLQPADALEPARIFAGRCRKPRIGLQGAGGRARARPASRWRII